MAMRTTLLLLIAVLIAAAPVASAQPRLEMRARPSFAFAPSDVRMEFRIAPDAANRTLEVSAESYEFFRGSVIQLEGERAPQVVSIEYHSLPAGDYSLRGALMNRKGDVVVMVEQQVTVMTTGGEH